jgi:hypothetical protein
MSRGPVVTLAAIVMLAATLRTIGLAYGLPAVYNPDEIAIMSRALAFGTGDLNPHNFLYPTLYFYLLFGWMGAYFVAARAVGVVGSLAEFERLYFVDPTSIYLAGRALSVVAGAATIVAVYVLGRRLFGRRAGLAAALFLAVAPLHVRDSHYVKHDVVATLAIACASIATLSLLSPPMRGVPARKLLWAALTAGMACAIHYYAVFVVLPLALAIWWSAPTRRDAVKDIALACVIAAGTFFTLSPFILGEPLTAWRDITANRQIVMDRAMAGHRGLLPTAPAYLAMLWRDAAGTPAIILAAFGAIGLAVQSRRTAAVFLAFPMVYFLFVSNTVAASRYLNPLLPFVVVLAGGAVELFSRRTRWALAVTAALAAAVPGLAASVRVGQFFRQTDTRTLAQHFIERELPPGSTVLVQPQSVQLTQSQTGLREALRAHLGDERRATIKFQRRLALNPYPAPAYRTLFLGDGGLDADKIYVSYAEAAGAAGVASLRHLGVQYVVLKREPDPVLRPLRSALRSEARLVQVVSPFIAENAAEPFLHNTDTRIDPALVRPGPIIEIWSLERPR